jgi:hypothetical protein
MNKTILLSKDAVSSHRDQRRKSRHEETRKRTFPATFTRTFFPPGCSAKNGVTLKTFPWMAIQQSSAVLCLASSEAETILAIFFPGNEKSKLESVFRCLINGYIMKYSGKRESKANKARKCTVKIYEIHQAPQRRECNGTKPIYLAFTINQDQSAKNGTRCAKINGVQEVPKRSHKRCGCAYFWFQRAPQTYLWYYIKGQYVSYTKRENVQEAQLRGILRRGRKWERMEAGVFRAENRCVFDWRGRGDIFAGQEQVQTLCNICILILSVIS